MLSTFAQLDTSQVLINRIYAMDSSSAVDFFALFPDDDAAESFNNAINGAVCCSCPSPMTLTRLPQTRNDCARCSRRHRR